MQKRADGYVDGRSRRQKCPSCGAKALAVERRGDPHKAAVKRCGACGVLIDEHGALPDATSVVTVLGEPCA